MAYGDYDGPNKPGKGKEGGSCNRTRCQCAPALWYNHGSFSWYCDDCKRQIDDAVGQRHWARDFPNAKHPMFETREMMTARAALSAQPAAAVVGEPEPIGYCSEYGLNKLASQAHHYCLSVSKAQENEFQFPIYASPSAPEDWNPIETAPKDGTKILAWSAFWEKYHLVRWNSDENAWCEGSWCFGSVPDMFWQPLPEPPTNALRQGRKEEGE